MVTGTADGRFSPRTYVVGPLPVQIEKGDFNRDGALDLAILCIGAGGAQGQQVAIMLNNGAGVFVTAPVLGLATADAAARFAVGDFNGDAWPDLAVLEPGAAQIRIGINKATALAGQFGFYERAGPIPAGFGARLIDAGRFDADARDDLIIVRTLSSARGAAAVLLARGEYFLAAGNAEFPLNPTCLVVHPIDRNGTLDCAVGGAAGGAGAACVIPGDGAGNLGAPALFALPECPAYIDAGDLDGNGTGDLVLVQSASRELVSVLVRDGEAPLPVFLRGDANGDGRLDVSDAVKSLRVLFAADPTDCAEALDVNRDGKLDISDSVYLLAYLFRAGPPPPWPFPFPGSVTPAQSLGCERVPGGPGA